MILQTMSKVVPLPCVKRVFYESEDQDGPELRARYRCSSCIALQFQTVMLLTGLIPAVIVRAAKIPSYSDLTVTLVRWLGCATRGRYIVTAGTEREGPGCRDWRVQDESAEKEQGSSEEAAKVEVAMMQLREQIRKLLDRGYSLPFTGTAVFYAQYPQAWYCERSLPVGKGSGACSPGVITANTVPKVRLNIVERT